MENYLFTQLNFIRNKTVSISQSVTEHEADIIPEGFRNNIRWNLGHIYVVQEMFAFTPIQLSVHIPEGYQELFASGTTPLDWSPNTPSLKEIISLLQAQHFRIQGALQNRLDEKVKEPYRTQSGLLLKSPREFLSFCLYHEGMHINTIKNFRTIILV